MVSRGQYELWFDEEANKLREEYGVVYLSKHRERMAERMMGYLAGLPAPLRWLELRLDLWARVQRRAGGEE